jgi:hypothetical protein
MPPIVTSAEIGRPAAEDVRGTDGPIRAAVDVLVEPVTGSRKEMPANLAALKQSMEAG